MWREFQYLRAFIVLQGFHYFECVDIHQITNSTLKNFIRDKNLFKDFKTNRIEAK